MAAENSLAASEPGKKRELSPSPYFFTAPAPHAQPMRPDVVRVREFRRETHDTFTLAFEAPISYPGFLPGQFNMLYAFGVGEAAISLSGDPGDREQIVHTIRAVGSVTRALERIEAGGQLGVRGPFGSAWPLREALGHDLVIVAGGIGLAPLRPVLYHVLRHRGDFGRIVLLCGARTPDDLLYAATLGQWRQRGDLQILITVDRGDRAWQDSVGLVTALFSQAEFDAERTIGMMCGPEVMMRFVQREFETRGVGGDRLFLSLERNMQCAVGFCGHCQFGPHFVCMSGPVYRHDRIATFFNIREA